MTTIQTIRFDDPGIKYSGSIRTSAEAALLTWTGSSVKIAFRGRALSACFSDEHGDNYFTIVVNGKEASILHLESGKRDYLIAEGLDQIVNSIELYKRTETGRGTSLFFYFTLYDAGPVLPDIVAKARLMAVIGDSISTGYALQDQHRTDNWLPAYEDGYNTYAAITARRFNAEYACTAISGIGVSASRRSLNILDLISGIVDENQYLGLRQPDLVVINLWQNDAFIISHRYSEDYLRWFGSSIPDKRELIKSYCLLTNKIRNCFPNAFMICSLGSMDVVKPGSPWINYLHEAVHILNDPKVLPFLFPYKGTRGHPSFYEHQNMSAHLIDFISEKLRWE
ncbi:MAG TPA: hypothetical protein VK609_03550 [Mucilaginibacter sp.]|nr:hypothetical protein [Mucilaginibacter sp.]